MRHASFFILAVVCALMSLFVRAALGPAPNAAAAAQAPRYEFRAAPPAVRPDWARAQLSRRQQRDPYDTRRP